MGESIPKLMRMQVPSNWSICDNKFYDVEPMFDKDGFIENWGLGFMEDVLWIREHGLGLEFPEFNHFSIALGWYPESDVSGSYKARLYWMATDERREIDTLISKDRFKIRDRMEFWMCDITWNYQGNREKMKRLTF